MIHEGSIRLNPDELAALVQSYLELCGMRGPTVLSLYDDGNQLVGYKMAVVNYQMSGDLKPLPPTDATKRLAKILNPLGNGQN